MKMLCREESFKDCCAVLVIRSLGGIGDVLMCTPLLQQIKSIAPQAHLTFAVEMHASDDYYQILKNAPFIDQIADARLVERSKYDCWVDLTSVCISYERQGLPPRNRINLFADAAGVKLDRMLPWYRVEPGEVFGRDREPMLVTLQGNAAEDKRSWPVRRVEELLLLGKKHNIRFLCMDKGVTGSNVTNISHLGIREKAAAIAASDLFVGPDSGPMHLAGALSVPSIVLFGSTPPEARINHYPTHQAITNTTLGCLGCWYQECNYKFKCMSTITAEMVMNKILEMLGYC